MCVDSTHIIVIELHEEGGHAAVDADEEVDAGQHHVGCAGNAEDEGGGVHHGGDGPPKGNNSALGASDSRGYFCIWCLPTIEYSV